MHRTPIVSEISPKWQNDEYDLVFCGIGYEARSRFVAEVFKGRAAHSFAFGFDVQMELEYAENRRFFEENGFQVSVVPDKQFAPEILKALRLVSLEDREEIRVLIDISSLSRFRIASYVDVLVREFQDLPVAVDFVYSLAAYDPPATSYAPNSHVGPVLSTNFAGAWDEPDRAVSAIVGLGYEPDKALGAVEYLEAADVWTFTPASEIPEYTSALQKANGHLLEHVTPEHQFVYLVHDPLDCFHSLEAVVSGVMQSRNVVLLPFGPKIFALSCVLVACIHPAAVWRVSAQGAEPAVNRRPNGSIFGIRAEFRTFASQAEY